MANFGYQSFDNSDDARDGMKLTAAMIDFRRARREAAMKAVLGRLQGTSLELLSYEEVAGQLQITGQVERGVQEIALDKIVGSVGRYDEFDRSFLPLKDHDAQRWASVRAWFDELLGDAEVSGEIGFEQGNLAEILHRRANLVDLLVLDTILLSGGDDENGAVLDKCARPVLLLQGAPRPVKRLLLLYDGQAQAHEALFVAAYMAEMWGCAVVLLAEAGAAPAALARAAPYLEMHEAPPESIIAGSLAPQPVFQTAVEHQCDLVVVGGHSRGPLSKMALAAWLHEAPQNIRRPLLICP